MCQDCRTGQSRTAWGLNARTRTSFFASACIHHCTCKQSCGLVLPLPCPMNLTMQNMLSQCAKGDKSNSQIL